MPGGKGTETAPLRRSSRIAAVDSPAAGSPARIMRTRRSSASSETSTSGIMTRSKRLSFTEETQNDINPLFEREKTPQKTTRGTTPTKKGVTTPTRRSKRINSTSPEKNEESDEEKPLKVKSRLSSVPEQMEAIKESEEEEKKNESKEIEVNEDSVKKSKILSLKKRLLADDDELSDENQLVVDSGETRKINGDGDVKVNERNNETDKQSKDLDEDVFEKATPPQKRLSEDDVIPSSQDLFSDTDSVSQRTIENENIQKLIEKYNESPDKPKVVIRDIKVILSKSDEVSPQKSDRRSTEFKSQSDSKKTDEEISSLKPSNENENKSDSFSLTLSQSKQSESFNSDSSEKENLPKNDLNVSRTSLSNRRKSSVVFDDYYEPMEVDDQSIIVEGFNKDGAAELDSQVVNKESNLENRKQSPNVKQNGEDSNTNQIVSDDKQQAANKENLDDEVSWNEGLHIQKRSVRENNEETVDLEADSNQKHIPEQPIVPRIEETVDSDVETVANDKHLENVSEKSVETQQETETEMAKEDEEETVTNKLSNDDEVKNVSEEQRDEFNEDVEETVNDNIEITANKSSDSVDAKEIQNVSEGSMEKKQDEKRDEIIEEVEEALDSDVEDTSLENDQVKDIHNVSGDSLEKKQDGGDEINEKVEESVDSDVEIIANESLESDQVKAVKSVSRDSAEKKQNERDEFNENVEESVDGDVEIINNLSGDSSEEKQNERDEIIEEIIETIESDAGNPANNISNCVSGDSVEKKQKETDESSEETEESDVETARNNVKSSKKSSVNVKIEKHRINLKSINNETPTSSIKKRSRSKENLFSKFDERSSLSKSVIAQIDDLIEKNCAEFSDSNDSDDTTHDFILGEADEGEEDTPSEDSNEILDDGESIFTTSTERDSSDDEYEKDSFLTDDDTKEPLLSGEEYDIFEVDDDDGIEKNKVQQKRGPTKSKDTEKKVKKSRIIRPTDSSDEEPADGLTKETQKPNEEAEKTFTSTGNQTESEAEKQHDQSTSTPSRTLVIAHSQTDRERVQLVPVLENANINEVNPQEIKTQIAEVVDKFLSTVQQEKVDAAKINLSLECSITSCRDENEEPVDDVEKKDKDHDSELETVNEIISDVVDTLIPKRKARDIAQQKDDEEKPEVLLEHADKGTPKKKKNKSRDEIAEEKDEVAAVDGIQVTEKKKKKQKDQPSEMVEERKEVVEQDTNEVSAKKKKKNRSEKTSELIGRNYEEILGEIEEVATKKKKQKTKDEKEEVLLKPLEEISPKKKKNQVNQEPSELIEQKEEEVLGEIQQVATKKKKNKTKDPSDEVFEEVLLEPVEEISPKKKKNKVNQEPSELIEQKEKEVLGEIQELAAKKKEKKTRSVVEEPIEELTSEKKKRKLSDKTSKFVVQEVLSGNEDSTTKKKKKKSKDEKSPVLKKVDLEEIDNVTPQWKKKKTTLEDVNSADATFTVTESSAKKDARKKHKKVDKPHSEQEFIVEQNTELSKPKEKQPNIPLEYYISKQNGETSKRKLDYKTEIVEKKPKPSSDEFSNKKTLKESPQIELSNTPKLLPSKQPVLNDDEIQVDYFPNNLLSTLVEQETQRKKSKRQSLIVTPSVVNYSAWDVKPAEPLRPSKTSHIEAGRVSKKMKKSKTNMPTTRSMIRSRDFKNQILYNPDHVRRIDTKVLLQKRLLK